MSDEYVRFVKTELEQALLHIDEALARVEMGSQDMCCINTILAAKDCIQAFLRNGIQQSFANLRLFEHSCPANYGWNPMMSKFPGIEGLWEKAEHKLHLHQENFRSVSGYGGLFQSSIKQCGVKPSGEFLSCKTCNVTCNSLSQLNQHVEGHRHQARIVSEDLQQRLILIYLSNRNKRFSLKTVQKAGNFCRSHDIAERNPSKGKWLSMKEAETSKQWCYGKRHKRALTSCELCNVTCNGNAQFLGHIKGKGHRKAVELCGKERNKN